ncbi:MAG TPA: hypothetical protein VFK33_06960 [Bacillales bacterium]|nr:hypothetical protein [Bacillales bacterium]
MENMSTDDKINMMLQMVKEVSVDVKDLKEDQKQIKEEQKQIKNELRQINGRLDNVEVGLKVFIRDTNENRVQIERIKDHVGLEF